VVVRMAMGSAPENSTVDLQSEKPLPRLHIVMPCGHTDSSLTTELVFSCELMRCKRLQRCRRTADENHRGPDCPSNITSRRQTGSWEYQTLINETLKESIRAKGLETVLRRVMREAMMAA
jgi:hypothetical protein